MRLFLVSLLMVGSLAAEDEQPKPELYIYLWDYEDARSRDVQAVRHLPPFWLSRFVREALEAPTDDSEMLLLREEIHNLAAIRVVDTPEVVDRLKCPAYAFGRWDNAVEFGNWCPVGPEGYRQCAIFREHSGLLKHLRYLIQLVQATGGSSVAKLLTHSRDQSQETRLVACQDGEEREVRVTTTVWAIKPAIDPWPPITFRMDTRTRVSWEARYGQDVNLVTESYAHDSSARGDTEPLLFYSQMDMGTGVLRHEILKAIAETYPTSEECPYWVKGEEYVIPLVCRERVTATYTGTLGDRLCFSNEEAEFECDLYLSKVRIKCRAGQTGNGLKGLYGIKGQWSQVDAVFGTIRKVDYEERFQSPFWGF